MGSINEIAANQSNTQSLKQLVIHSIREEILSGRVNPGDRLMEKNLAEQIGVSRTPVREALNKLEQEGFVKIIPRRGAIVTVLKKRDIENVLEIRGTLEALAAKRACEHADQDLIKKLECGKRSFEQAVLERNLEKMASSDMVFHDIIFTASRNNKLVQLLNNLGEQIYRYRVTYLKDSHYRKKIMEEHDLILHAIRNNLSDEASAAALLHIKNQENAIINAIHS